MVDGAEQLSVSVPAQGVFSHDRRRDLLCANTAPLTAAASLAASTARRYSTVTGTVHPSSSATRNRAVRHTTAGARHRAGALVSETLVSVPAGDEEHGRSVGNGAHNGTGGDTSSRSVDGTAGGDVTPDRASVTSPTARCGTGVSGLVGNRAVGRKFAGWKRAGGVDQARKIIDSGVLVVPERISWVAKLSL